MSEATKSSAPNEVFGHGHAVGRSARGNGHILVIKTNNPQIAALLVD
jgi:hypothetical protein